VAESRCDLKGAVRRRRAVALVKGADAAYVGARRLLLKRHAAQQEAPTSSSCVKLTQLLRLADGIAVAPGNSPLADIPDVRFSSKLRVRIAATALDLQWSCVADDCSTVTFLATKNGRTRTVPCPPEVREMLAALTRGS
jgi:hypothetical protein